MKSILSKKITTFAKYYIEGSSIEGFVRLIFRKPKLKFVTSPQYWEHRYNMGGNSGAGSYGRLAYFKAKILNHFVSSNNIKSVIEFGCGDGNQLSLSNYPEYVGIDISKEAIKICRDKFKNDTAKRFMHLSQYSKEQAELALSLDVIYHLVEDEIYHEYLIRLFDSAARHVIIYSSNKLSQYTGDHVRHRLFTSWVAKNRPDFRLLKMIPNQYPYNPTDSSETSFADFFVYERLAKKNIP